MLSPAVFSKLLVPKAASASTAAACSAPAWLLISRSFGEFPKSRTRSVDQDQAPGSSPARSPDAPADPTELKDNEGAHQRGSPEEREALRQASWKSSEVFTGNDIRQPGESGSGRRRYEAPDTPKKGPAEIVSEVAGGLADKAKSAVGDVAAKLKGHKDDTPSDYKRAAERIQDIEGMPENERKV